MGPQEAEKLFPSLWNEIKEDWLSEPVKYLTGLGWESESENSE